MTTPLAFVLVGILAATPPPRKTLPAPEDVAAAPADAVTTASGLAWKLLQPGKGEAHPSPTDVATVHYTSWTPDGQMFESTVLAGAPTTLSLDRAIPGLAEGLPLMTAGEKRRFWLPAGMGYKGARAPQGMVVFDVELISFVASPSKAPADVAAPPPDATTTASGLAYKVLRPGTGTVHPRKGSVTVHYSGWTTDGKLFDSSLLRGEPATLALDAVIPGWKEGLKLMVEGERTRFWIPERLAYKGKQAPFGALVFDVELLKFE
jgi:peptidylprolyl isomerase